MVAPLELPDFMDAMTLVGWDGSTYRVVALDDAGNIVALLKGADSGGTPRTIRVDGDGQIVAVLKGASGYEVGVDSGGNLAALLKGMDSGSVTRTLRVDDDGQIIAVLKGASGNNIAVDGDGFIAALLKANDGGTSRAVACDEDGRLKFFLTDNVDQWGRYLEVGNAELASRLKGTVVSWERSGQVLYRGTFEHGLGPWKSTTYGSGAVAHETTTWLQDGGSAKLSCGAVDADYATVTLTLGLVPSAQIIGFGGCFRYADEGEYLRFRIEYYDGTNRHRISVRLTVSGGNIHLLDQAGAWQDVGDWPTGGLHTNTWRFFKVTADLNTGYYSRIILDNTEIDVSAYQYYKSASSNEHALYSVHVNGAAGNASELYVDSLVVTTKDT